MQLYNLLPKEDHKGRSFSATKPFINTCLLCAPSPVLGILLGTKSIAHWTLISCHRGWLYERSCHRWLLTWAMPSTSSMTPWGKQGEEATTSTVLRVSARATAAAVTLMSFPTGTCRQQQAVRKVTGHQGCVVETCLGCHHASPHFKPVIGNMLLALTCVVFVSSWSKLYCALSKRK